MNNLGAITVTMVFEGPALNRGEKIANDVLSVKKLTRYGKEEYSYLSREAIRHYLFNTLRRTFNGRWAAAPTTLSGTGSKTVVQFDLSKSNILTHHELDAFGYMVTLSGGNTGAIKRKKTVHITKAISLEPYKGDRQFSANHDLAERAGVSPNPYQKEEHESQFAVSFTIDCEMLGKDEWVVQSVGPFDMEKGLPIEFSGAHTKHTIKDVSVTRAKDGTEVYKKDDSEISYDKKCTVTISKKLLTSHEDEEGEPYLSFEAGKRQAQKGLKITSWTCPDDDTYSFIVGDFDAQPQKGKTTQNLVISGGLKFHISGLKPIEGEDSKYKYVDSNGKEIGTILVSRRGPCISLSFKLSEDERKKILNNILFVIKNGLIYDTAENAGIKPDRLVVAGLRIPVPIFHNRVDVDPLDPTTLDNGYICTTTGNNGKKAVYVKGFKNLHEDVTNSVFADQDWDRFLDQLGLLPRTEEDKERESK